MNLEWLINQRYPNGVECPTCKRVTKHHKVAKRSCYACDSCGHQVYPTAGTVFYKSHIPLKTWMQVMHDFETTNGIIPPKEIQRKFGLSYKTSKLMLQKIKDLYKNTPDNFVLRKAEQEGLVLSGSNERRKYNKSLSDVSPQKSLGNSIKKYQKRDRLARLMKIEVLLAQHPNGISIDEIASKCSVSRRTIYRDLIALEEEVGTPIWENKNQRGIIDGHHLPPIHLSSQEAMRIFLVLRLFLIYFHIFDPHSAGAFLKLSLLIPWPLRQQVQKCLQYMDNQPRNKDLIEKMDTCVEAWFSRRRVKFTVHEIYDEMPIDRIFDIYFIEPRLWGHSNWLIGYCHYKKSMYAYKIDRILSDVYLMNETYEIPENFDPLEYLESTWNMFQSEELITAKLRFAPRLNPVVRNTIWHPSQQLQFNEDGSVLMTLTIRDTLDFRAWIWGWESDVEVLEPESLRRRFLQTCTELISVYKKQE